MCLWFMFVVYVCGLWCRSLPGLTCRLCGIITWWKLSLMTTSRSLSRNNQSVIKSMTSSPASSRLQTTYLCFCWYLYWLVDHLHELWKTECDNIRLHYCLYAGTWDLSPATWPWLQWPWDPGWPPMWINWKGTQAWLRWRSRDPRSTCTSMR